jgi:hypothetical protein
MLFLSRFINFCYDHFGVFHFFSILAVSMATVAILKKSTDNRHRFWNWEPYYDPSDHIISCYYSSSSFFLSFFRQKFVFHISRGVNLTFFAPWLPWQRPPF